MIALAVMSGAPVTRVKGDSLTLTSSDGSGAATLDLHDFGAVGDGQTDDGPALQHALNALADAGGGTLVVPAGNYVIATPVAKDFGGVASITIQGVESNTPVPPPADPNSEVTQGLNLSTQFLPRTGEQHAAISLSGLRNLLIKDVAFVGTPDVLTDALITVNLSEVADATVRHCEFYALSSYVEGGAIVQAMRSNLKIEQSEFLGCMTSSGYSNSVVQNIEWKGITVAECVFADYGQRPELYGKTGLGASYSWINVGNAAAVTADSPRREATFRGIFLDEGALIGITSLPDQYQPPSAPIDLLYITGLYINVSNLEVYSGSLFSGLQGVLVENAYYTWSQNTPSAIVITGVSNAILDRVVCDAAANTISANSTGRLVVIASTYAALNSNADVTQVITPGTPDDDPVQYVRAQFKSLLGREPDAAAHFYWSDQLSRCGDDPQCLADRRAALTSYLAASPSQTVALTGRITDGNGNPLAGTEVALSGSQFVTARSDASGFYHFDGLPSSGRYTVMPSNSTYTFTPPRLDFTNPAASQSANFTSATTTANPTPTPMSSPTAVTFVISGKVTQGGQGVANATVALSGGMSATAQTTENGTYAFNAVPAGANYAVTPFKKDYTFDRANVSFSALSANQIADFVATLQTVVEFSDASYSVGEGEGSATIAVTREGNTSSQATVVFEAQSGTARQGSDFVGSIGEITFAPGETTKTLKIFITDDAFVEGAEQFMLTLTEKGKAVVGVPRTAAVTINDNDTVLSSTNPVDETEFFVSQNYRDFLLRDPDAPGLQFWTSEINSCGADVQCREVKRVNVSAAFFLSIEFQNTGYLVYRMYKAAYAREPSRVVEFMLDSRIIGDGVVVGQPGWEQNLEGNKVAYTRDFVEQPGFVSRYATSLTPAQFVAALNSNTGGTLTGEEVAAAAAEFGGAPDTSDLQARSRALRVVAENRAFYQQEFNRAFVMMQYFGYLRRAPDEPPDANMDGFNFWLTKLNEFSGDYQKAEMVKAFIRSSEYRGRFGN